MRSEAVVARDFQGEFIIVPLTAGIGDLEDDLYSLNETGQAIWERLDGRRTLGQIAQDLACEFNAPVETIECDVVGLAGELLARGILEAISPPPL